ncbi:hypothetical protein DUNSADRAFT_16331 [Dunaliella salina]|uniref:Encoded protein n=1 Tax=Dunaliella salina TaxID=3046 RepID=A0ABQ7G3S3_DUNSA|nr:hypothetical protein DUNSADRAFT_16331 [Dunaliella salina]|eukprot:KAF5829258.1 hypothetical protein DUNSADRAFT_16331 [Dunaliella salina]
MSCMDLSWNSSLLCNNCFKQWNKASCAGLPKAAPLSRESLSSKNTIPIHHITFFTVTSVPCIKNEPATISQMIWAQML